MKNTTNRDRFSPSALMIAMALLAGCAGAATPTGPGSSGSTGPVAGGDCIAFDPITELAIESEVIPDPATPGDPCYDPEQPPREKPVNPPAPPVEDEPEAFF